MVNTHLFKISIIIIFRKNYKRINVYIDILIIIIINTTEPIIMYLYYFT